MNKFRAWIGVPGVGTYVGVAAGFFSFLAGLVYLISYSGSVYLNVWGALLPMLVTVVFAPLALFAVTRPYAPAVLVAVDFIGFMIFVQASYLYLSEVFFGINGMGDALARLGDMNAGYVLTVLFYLFAVILANVALYLKKDGKQKGVQA